MNERRTSTALAIALVLALAGCGRAGPEGEWVRADLMTIPDGVAPDALPEPGSRGARLAVRYCSQCHGVPTPKRHSAADWIPTLRRMFSRMDHMSSMGGMMGGRRGRGTRGMMGGDRGRMPMGMHGVDAPSEAERADLVAYYTGHAMRAIDPGSAPAGAGSEAFRDRCSRCHALPDPAAHAPGEWPAVVERMRGNMERAGVEGLSDAEAEAIVGYLRRSSGATE